MPHPFPWPFKPVSSEVYGPIEPKVPWNYSAEADAVALVARLRKQQEHADRNNAEAHGMTREDYEKWQALRLQDQQERMRKALVGGQTAGKTRMVYDEETQPPYAIMDWNTGNVGYRTNPTKKEKEPMNLQEEITKVTPGVVTVFDVAREAFGDEEGKGATKVTVELSHKPHRPLREETGARAHVFHTAHALADYLAGYGSDETVVYCDLEAGEFCATLCECAGDGVQVVTMRPVIHPLWKPWAGMVAGTKMPVKQLAAFLRPQRRQIVEPDAKELLLALSQITASLQVTKHEGSGKSALNGVLVKTRIQGKDDTALVELPEVLKVEVPLFVGSYPQAVEIDLVLEADAQGNVFAFLTAPDIEADKQMALQAGVDRLRGDKRLADRGTVVVLGRPDWVQWKVVP